ncbi:JAB domain-containing protein [Escherichia coli]|uniref:JAB domain-containing protein n=1 Tax=Escherichia coli TaxID=562 RepID=UPI000F4A36D3
MDRLCEDYCGGIWNLYTLNNGGAFMAPEPDDDDDETWVLFNAMNGNRAEMSPEAAGIAACLMTYSHHACRTECYAMTVHYYRLNQNQLIAGETLFTGTINRTEVHPREVIKRALYHNAAAVVLAHNHPSGEVTPSKADRLITERLVQALGLVDIRVPDHLIVGGSQVFSFAEYGLL